MYMYIKKKQKNTQMKITVNLLKSRKLLGHVNSFLARKIECALLCREFSTVVC